MNFAHSLFTTCTGLALTPLLSQADILHVSPPGGGGGYVKIQDAINAAHMHDEIIVDPIDSTGLLYVYRENLRVQTNLTIRSSNPGTKVEVDGMAIDSVLWCDANITPHTQFSDLIFINGRASFGGGANLEGADPIFTNCEFRENNAVLDGGGVWSTGSPTFQDCLFKGNMAFNDQGGGLFCSFGVVHIDNSTFESNTARSSGGGICGSNHLILNITNTTFDANKAFGNGGGVAVENNCDVTILDATIKSNTAENGGSIHARDSHFVLNSSTLTSGLALLDAGHVYSESSSFEVTESEFQSGVAGSNGGMMYLNNSSWTGQDNLFQNGDAPVGAMIWAKDSSLDLDSPNFDTSTSVGKSTKRHGRSMRFDDCDFSADGGVFESLGTDEPYVRSLVLHTQGTATYDNCVIKYCAISNPGSTSAGGYSVKSWPTLVYNIFGTVEFNQCDIFTNNTGRQGNILLNSGSSGYMFVNDSQLRNNGVPFIPSLGYRRTRFGAVCQHWGVVEVEDTVFCGNSMRPWAGSITDLGGNTKAITCP